MVGLGLRARIGNVPDVEDTRVLRSLIERFGGTVRNDDGWWIDTRDLRAPDLTSLPCNIHGSLYLIPAVLGRFSEVRFPGSGGCRIGGGPGGERPVSHVIDVLRQFGARLEVEGTTIAGTAGRFQACDIDILRYSDDPTRPNGPLVSGATKTAIIAAALCERGTTTIRHPYPKVDVTDLLAFLQWSGCCEVARSRDLIAITASAPRDTSRDRFELVDDISEFMTYVAFSVLHALPIRARARQPERMRIALAPELETLARLGIDIRNADGGLALDPPERVTSIDLEATSEGIYSDHQPFFALMQLRGDREASLLDRVWTGRYAYAPGLIELGADISVDRDALRIRPSRLTRRGKLLTGHDTRSAAALLIASLQLPGTRLRGAATHLGRGYDDFLTKLRSMGASISSSDEDWPRDATMGVVSP
jgi:UDP-N-acetylglucosamine 1-carboxyvinyltransferase